MNRSCREKYPELGMLFHYISDNLYCIVGTNGFDDVRKSLSEVMRIWGSNEGDIEGPLLDLLILLELHLRFPPHLENIVNELIQRLKVEATFSPSYIISSEPRVFDVRQDMSIYIYVICHPKSNSLAGQQITSRIDLLDRMTRKVTIIIPGYARSKEEGGQLLFDEQLFFDVVQDLEDKARGHWHYTDACELLIVDATPEGAYDFDNYLYIDLDSGKGISKLWHSGVIPSLDPIKLLLAIAAKFGIGASREGKWLDLVDQVIEDLYLQSCQKSYDVYNVFIAGSKELASYRAMMREELSKVQNQLDMNIRSYTFEDFPPACTGKDGGQQALYNKFIAEKADVVVFLFTTEAGEITADEFDVAYKALQKNLHRPTLYVYMLKEGRFSLRRLFPDPTLKSIRQRVSAHNKEYYIEYKNLENLRYLFYSSMEEYFRKRK